MANEQCNNLLKDGVYAKHNLVRTENHDVNYQHYFASDEFRNEFLNNKYSLGVEVVIYGVPVKLNYGSDETTVREFQKKIRETTDFKLIDNFFLNISQSYGDKDVLDAFTACNKDLGFKITVFPTGQTITFKVFYTNIGGDYPILEGVYISTGGRLVFQSLKIGEKFFNNLEATFTFELDSSIKELFFVVDTNLTSTSEKVTISKRAKTDGSPLGTIITSFLSWSQFQSVTENNKESNGIWKSEFSYWAPCDGREIPNSEFQKLTSLNRVPDLRGVFLRGRNTFDDAETTTVTYADPKPNRQLGDYQEDGIATHSHIVGQVNAPLQPGNEWRQSTIVDGGLTDAIKAKTSDFGGTETRPKNIAINYYIRIN